MAGMHRQQLITGQQSLMGYGRLHQLASNAGDIWQVEKLSPGQTIGAYGLM
jgi:hypothetical protein